MIAQQSADMNGKSSGGFSDMFSTIVTVGASVRSNGQALEGAEATRKLLLDLKQDFRC